jgi:hypothetical protein
MTGDHRSAYRFRLVDLVGNDLGPLASHRSDWTAGERIARRHGESFLVVNVVPAPDGDAVHGYIVVTEG